jgi:hypothetical protein
VAPQEFVWCHRQEHVFASASTHVQHPSDGIETQHGVLALELPDLALEVELEAELHVRLSVGKQGRETQAVPDRQVVVDVGRLGVHPNLADALLQLELLVDDELVTAGEQGQDVLVVLVVELLEPGQLEIPRVVLVELLCGSQVQGGADDLFHDVGLRSCGIVVVDGERVGDGGDVGGSVFNILGPTLVTVVDVRCMRREERFGNSLVWLVLRRQVGSRGGGQGLASAKHFVYGK